MPVNSRAPDTGRVKQPYRPQESPNTSELQ